MSAQYLQINYGRKSGAAINSCSKYHYSDWIHCKFVQCSPRNRSCISLVGDGEKREEKWKVRKGRKGKLHPLFRIPGKIRLCCH